MRYVGPFVLVSALVSCGRTLKSTDTGREDAAAQAPVERMPIAALAELPTGHWESGPSYASDHLCLTIYPHGGVRIVVPAPGYRHPARITGTIAELRRSPPNRFEITIDVAKIVAKEIGPCRKSWVDYDLHESLLLGTRITPPLSDGGAIQFGHYREPVSADAGSASRIRIALTLAEADGGSAIELCSLDEPLDASATASERCRTLTRQPSTHTVLGSSGPFDCKTDADCLLEPIGEACDPCNCERGAYSIGALRRRDEQSPPEPHDPGRSRFAAPPRTAVQQRDESRWAMQRECPPRPQVTCAPCPRKRARCNGSYCVAVAAEE